MMIIPSAQVNVPHTSQCPYENGYSVIFLPNHILFMDLLFSINQVPEGFLPESRADDLSHHNTQQGNKVLEGIGEGLFILSEAS